MGVVAGIFHSGCGKGGSGPRFWGVMTDNDAHATNTETAAVHLSSEQPVTEPSAVEQSSKEQASEEKTPTTPSATEKEVA